MEKRKTIRRKLKESQFNFGLFINICFCDSHIREHLKSLAEKTDEIPPDLSDEDMIYYLFLIHDVNGDGFLDGHELRTAFTDFGDEHEDATQYLSLDEVTEMVDHVLEEDDLDGE
jgi:Ca2+-binding EF-hand superfamily protein